MNEGSNSKPRLTISLTGVGIAALLGAIPGIAANLKGEPKAELAYERISKEVEEMSAEQRQLHDRLVKLEAYWELAERKQQCQGMAVKKMEVPRRDVSRRGKGSVFDYPKLPTKKSLPSIQQQAPMIRKMPPLEFGPKK